MGAKYMWANRRENVRKRRSGRPEGRMGGTTEIG
jgi:hypothetical protein